MALEIRWFFEGSMPSEVVSWFHEEALGDFRPSTKQRTDVYLITADENVGIKLRKGKLEIKWRQKHEPFGAAEERVKGQVEYWHKWVWRDPEGESTKEILDALEQDSDIPWIEIAKERQQRKYELAKDEFVAVPLEDRPARGCAVEITKLSLQGKTWWTLALDIFGEDKEVVQTLRQRIETLVADYPGPELHVENSSGYPAWLWTVVKQTPWEEAQVHRP